MAKKAKAQKFTVSFTVTLPAESLTKAKDLKNTITGELGYVTDTIEGFKLGKVSVVAE